MTSEEIKKLKEKKEYLERWLSQVKKVQETVPDVQKNLEVTRWEIDVLTNQPDEASEIPLTGLTSVLEEESNYWISALPMIDSNSDLVTSAGSISASGTANLYDYVTRVGDIGTPEAVSYSQKYLRLYHELQTTQDRPQIVRNFLEQLNNPQTIERFDRASNTYLATKAGTEQRTTAALEMRNLLDGVKGDLFKMARKHPQDNMTWEKMAERLAKGGSTGTEYQELIRQQENRSALISRLSDILKDREGGSATNLDNVWIQVINHIYTVLGLIALPNV